MLDINWEDRLCGLPVQEMTSNINQAIMDAVEKTVPTKKITPNAIHRKPLWMNETALRIVRKKHHAWIRYLNTKDGEDYQRYIAARNKATHTIRRTRKEFESRLAKESRTNNKVFWNYVNSRRKSKVSIPALRREDGTLVEEDEEKAEILNRSYTKVFTREDMTTFPTFDNKVLLTELNIRLTKEAVLKQLQSLKVDKSPGPDLIHPRVLHELAETLSTPLYILFKASLDEGIVPKQWKTATVTPIYKKGDKTDSANYRPVSLTSVICKIFERILSEGIMEHLKANNLCCEQQHGFIGGKSTVTNLLEAMYVWTEALSHNLPVDIIFLDYAKAFDTVPHERLLAKISAMGIRGNILAWIRGFLTDRRQRVSVNAGSSGWADVISGVPQGSVLGPLLFTMYVSDIPDVLQNFVSMFADDTKLYQAVDVQTNSNNLQNDIDQLQAWAQSMQMRFHPEKCKAMHMGPANPRCKYQMTSTSNELHTLQVVEEEKDLGVIVDCQLKFSTHIQTQVNKANRVLGAIKHTFLALDRTAFINLYKSLVRPHLEYASAVWNPKLKRDKDALEGVQRRATRLVEGLSHLSYPERLAKLQLPTLQFRRQRADIIQAFKTLKKIDKLNYTRECSFCGGAMFQPTLSTTTRGHDLKLQVQHQQGLKKNFFSARVTDAWNKLSPETVNATSVESFKTRLAKEWGSRLDLYQFIFSY